MKTIQSQRNRMGLNVRRTTLNTIREFFRSLSSTNSRENSEGTQLTTYKQWTQKLQKRHFANCKGEIESGLQAKMVQGATQDPQSKYKLKITI